MTVQGLGFILDPKPMEITMLMNNNKATQMDTLTHQSEERLVEFTRSELFAKTFREGMDMVEEAAAYLDGPGRQDAKRLARNLSLIHI